MNSLASNDVSWQQRGTPIPNLKGATYYTEGDPLRPKMVVEFHNYRAEMVMRNTHDIIGHVNELVNRILKNISDSFVKADGDGWSRVSS